MRRFRSNVSQEIEALKLKEFRCQVKKCSFEEFQSIISRMNNIKQFSWMLITEIHRENLLQTDFVNLEKWKDFISTFLHLYQFDCSIKCPSKSSSEFPYDFIRIFGQKSNRLMNIQMDNTNKDEVRLSLHFFE